MLQPRFLIVGAMVLLPAIVALAPYVLQAVGLGAVHDPSLPWNLNPLTALCLFGGAYLADRRWAYAVPILSLALKSLGIALLMRDLTFGFHPLMPVVWGSFLLMVWLGTWLRNGPTGALARVLSIAGAALAGEIL